MNNRQYNVSSLDSIVRYNTRTVNHKESVAAHSWYVSYYILRLLDELNFTYCDDADFKNSILKFGIIHDMAEIFTGDVSHAVKSYNKDIRNVLNTLENTFYKKSDLDEIIQEFETRGTQVECELRYKIFKIADLLSVLSYVENEQKLGNSTLTDIYDQTVMDLETLLNDCSEYHLFKNLNTSSDLKTFFNKINTIVITHDYDSYNDNGGN